jgi:hypothetical protein
VTKKGENKMDEEKSVQDKWKTIEIPEEIEFIIDNLKELLEAYGDAIDVGRHYSESVKNMLELQKNIVGGTSFGLGLLADASKALRGWNSIIDTLNDENLTDLQRFMKLGSGFSELFAGASGLFEKIPFFGELSGAFDAVGGVFKSGGAITALIEEEKSLENIFGNSCEIVSGFLDSAAGLAKVSGLAPLAIPLNVLSLAFSKAGKAFKDGDWVLGAFWLSLGATLSLILLEVVTALMSAMGTSMNTFAATLLTNIVTIAAGLAMIIAISALLIAAFASTPSVPTIDKYEKGGFPEQGLPFIARESGAELVGIVHTMQGRRTAVINNDQIIEGIEKGVSMAVTAAMNGDITGTPAIARVFLDGKEIAMAYATNKNEEKNK